MKGPAIKSIMLVVLWSNNIQHWKMDESTMKACDNVSSHDKKMQVGSYFVVRAGLRNDEFVSVA